VDSALEEGALISEITEVEVPTAINRRLHLHLIDGRAYDEYLRSAADVIAAAISIELNEAVKREANEVSRVYPLRALDAIQVASAAIADRTSKRRGGSVAFITADLRQADAARSIFGERRTILLDPI